MKKQRIIRMNPQQFLGMLKKHLARKGHEGLEELTCQTFISIDGQSTAFYATHDGLSFFATERDVHIAKSDRSFYETIDDGFAWCENCDYVREFVVDNGLAICSCGAEVETSLVDTEFMKLVLSEVET